MKRSRAAARIGRFVSIVALVAVPAVPGLTEAGDAGGLEDAVITAKVKTAILLNRHLDSFRINVETDGGVVTLKGLVRDAPLKELAEEIARTVDGVERVENRLRIDRDGEDPPPPEDRTFTQKIRDASIIASVKSALLLRKGIRADLIGVGSRWGVVTLEGRVDSEEQRQLVLGIVADLYDVREVRDHLDVLPAPAEAGRPGAQGDQVPDLLITSQVNQALALSRRVDAAGIAVRAEDGVVTLSGRVASPAERDEAIRVAASVWGVNTVVDRLEIAVLAGSGS
jgi:osmotically-inducible protein OsmY